MTVRLILISYKNNRLTFQARAVIFLSWHHDSFDTRVIPVMIARSRYGFVLNVALNKPLINPVNSSQYPLIIYNDIL